MKGITIYPENEKQKSLLKMLLQEMKIRFEMEEDETAYSEEEFYSKIEKSLEEAENGKSTVLSKDDQKNFLGL